MLVKAGDTAVLAFFSVLFDVAVFLLKKRKA
jgi:hypothetical protein